MICIDSDGYYLTHGKKYEIVCENDNMDRVGVVNDIGQLSEYPKRIFQ